MSSRFAQERALHSDHLATDLFGSRTSAGNPQATVPSERGLDHVAHSLVGRGDTSVSSHASKLAASERWLSDRQTCCAWDVWGAAITAAWRLSAGDRSSSARQAPARSFPPTRSFPPKRVRCRQRPSAGIRVARPSERGRLAFHDQTQPPPVPYLVTLPRLLTHSRAPPRRCPERPGCSASPT
jgi:hypothetical protein